MQRQRGGARTTMPIAARALHFTERDRNGSLRITRLNTQIQIDHRVAAVAGNDQPVIF